MNHCVTIQLWLRLFNLLRSSLNFPVTKVIHCSSCSIQGRSVTRSQFLQTGNDVPIPLKVNSNTSSLLSFHLLHNVPVTLPCVASISEHLHIAVYLTERVSNTHSNLVIISLESMKSFLKIHMESCKSIIVCHLIPMNCFSNYVLVLRSIQMLHIRYNLWIRLSELIILHE